MLFAVSAYAQLNVSSVIEKEPEKIMTLHATYSWLVKTSDGYVFQANTDNRFDKHYSHIFLGETPEGAIQTLTDLKSIMDNKVASVTAEQSTGKFTLQYANQLGTKMIWIKNSVNAGKSWISYQQVNKLLEYFQNLEV